MEMEVAHSEVIAVMERLYPEHLRVCVLTAVNAKQAEALRDMREERDQAVARVRELEE